MVMVKIKKNKEFKQQIKILRQRRYDKLQNRALKPSKAQYLYFKKILLNKKNLLFGTLIFIALRVILEMTLIVSSHGYLNNQLSLNNLLIELIIIATFYLITSYQAIKYEKTLIVYLINDLRLDWFKIFISKKIYENSLEEKSSLVAKISYHLPLLSSGMANSLMELIRVIALLAVLLSISIIFSWNLIYLFLLSIVGSFICIFIGYTIAKRYVTKETTFYTQILKTIDFSLSDWHFTKYFHREKSILNEFTKLVNLDSFFRIRRELWMKFSSSFIFIFSVFIILIINNYSQEIGKFLLQNAQKGSFITAIFIIYIFRIFYSSLRIGLYSVPTLLGLKLSIPEKKSQSLRLGLKLNKLSIEFKGSKLKLFKKDKYHKNINFIFDQGGRYLINGDKRSGKSSLARTFVGQADFGRRAWIIKYNKKRFFYNDFFSSFSNFYYIDPNFQSNRSVLEIALGIEKKFIKDQDFIKLIKIIEDNPILQDLFFARHDWRLKADKELNNPKGKLLMQVLYCLWHKPAIITIDNYWLDCEDQEFNKIIELLSKSLTDSTIISFSQKKKEGKYNNYYEI